MCKRNFDEPLDNFASDVEGQLPIPISSLFQNICYIKRWTRQSSALFCSIFYRGSNIQGVGGCRYPSIDHRLEGNRSYNFLYNCSCQLFKRVTKCTINMSLIVKPHLFKNISLFMSIYVHLSNKWNKCSFFHQRWDP